MPNTNAICVSSVVDNNKIRAVANPPEELRKYFNTLELIVNYDESLNADKSIVNIPIISTVLPLAWLTGADIHVDSLDKKYFEAVNSIKEEFHLIFPKGKFTTKIIVDEIVDNKTNSKETALLFSGGIDATYSLVRNIKLKPRLLMYWGVNHYQLNSMYDKSKQLTKKTYFDFAKKMGLEINFIEMNASNVLNDARISNEFRKVLRGADVYPSLKLPLFLLGLLAPFSICRFGKVLIAATLDPEHDYIKYPYGSQPNIDEKFAWADLRVTHDGYVHRFKKTLEISDFLIKNNSFLRVCNRPPYDKLNCSNCEKCYGTILSLILQGIDPNTCGFYVDKVTIKSIKAMFEDKRLDGYEMAGNLEYWRVLQKMIPIELQNDLYGSKAFFEWFRKYDIDKLIFINNLKNVTYRKITNVLPYSVLNYLNLSIKRFKNLKD